MSEVSIKDQLLAMADAKAPTVEYGLPSGEGTIKIQGILKHSEINALMESVGVYKEQFCKKGAIRYNEATVEAAVWIFHCVIEPKLTMEEWLKVLNNAGLWTNLVMVECQKACGINVSSITKIIEDIKKNPFDEDTSKPVSTDSENIPKK